MKDFFGKFALVFVIGFAIFGVSYLIGTWILLKINYKYTVGITGNFVGHSSHSYVGFSFRVNNKLCHGDTDPRVKYPGVRYIVKYSPLYPAANEMLREYEVTDSALIPPPEGWDRIPDKIKPHE